MAGITHLDQFQEPALRGLVDETLQETIPGFASQYLPEEDTFDMQYRYNIIKNTNHIAAMIAYGAEPPTIDRNAVANMSGELGKFGLKDIVTEEELLKLHQSRSKAENASMIDQITFRGIDLVQAMQRQVEIIKAKAITQGTYEYNRNQVKATVDFQIPSENKKALTSGSDWAEADHDVIGDLLAWTQEYANNNSGTMPEVILISREAQSLLLKNAVIVTEAVGSSTSGRNRVSVDELQTVLGGYGLPPVQVVTDRFVAHKDLYTGEMVTTEVFPANRVIMLASGVGKFLFGPTVENNFQPGVVLTAYDKQEPIQSILRTVATGFPVIEVPSLIFHADVYTP